MKKYSLVISFSMLLALSNQEIVINYTYFEEWADDYPWYIIFSTIGGFYNDNEGFDYFDMGYAIYGGFRCVRTLQSSSE